MSETATITVQNVKKVKEGDGKKGHWTLYGVVDGNDDLYSFLNNRTLYEEAQKFEGERAEIEFEVTGEGYRNLKAIKAATGSNGDTPALGTGEYVTGQKPPIEARRIGASTAAHVAGQLTIAFLTHRTPSQEVTPDYVRTIYDAMESHVYTQAARRGEYLGEPPF